MSVGTAQSLLDELPNMDDNRHVYAPVIVFGYIGYQQTFNLELPMWIIPFIGVRTSTPLEMAIFSAALVSLSAAFVKQGGEGLELNEKIAERNEKIEEKSDQIVDNNPYLSNEPRNSTESLNDISGFPGAEDSPLANASRALQAVGWAGFLLVLILHLESIYAIYITQLYSASLIGLAISIFQLLVMVSVISETLSKIVHKMMKFIARLS